jgi:hypothetical protein
MAKLQKEQLKKYIEGHYYTNKIIIEEKIERLHHITIQDSSNDYDHLCDIWFSASNKENLEAIDAKNIPYLIKRRKKLNKQSERR